MWGVCTAGFSVCRSLNEGYLFWAINGIGLSLVIPTGQSLIADYYQVGSMICKLLCTTAESQRISGLYAPVWDNTSFKQSSLTRMQCLCVGKHAKLKLVTTARQASILYMSLRMHCCTDIMQNAGRQVLIPLSLLEYHMMPADCEVALLVVC